MLSLGMNITEMIQHFQRVAVVYVKMGPSVAVTFPKIDMYTPFWLDGTISLIATYNGSTHILQKVSPLFINTHVHLFCFISNGIFKGLKFQKN